MNEDASTNTNANTNTKMTGWKTWTGAAIIGVSAALDILGYGQYTQAVMMLGSAFGLVGIGHKLEKATGK